MPIHRRDRTGSYAVDRFIAGEKPLHAIERRELGEVADRRLIHLQCHFGLDTLTLARQRAAVTGLDFSPAAIAEARQMATAIGVAADFVCVNVYEARQVVTGHFDIVYTTWGTICWLPDLVAWARTIASLLVPGGFLYFADAHPNMLALEERDGRLIHECPLDTPVDRPLVFDTPQTYSGDPTPLAASRTYEWIHSVSRLVNALARGRAQHAGLPWAPFPMCVHGEDGLWHLPDGIPAFPLSLSLRARNAVN